MGSTRAAAALIDANRPERALTELAPVLAAHPDDSEALRLAAIASARCGRGLDAVEFAPRMRLGRHAGALFSELRRRRFATVVAAALVPLSAVAWIVAAARPSTGPLWYNLAMLPGVMAAIVTVVSGSFRRGR